MAVRSWLGAAMALVLAGCGTATGVAQRGRAPAPTSGASLPAPARLVSYESCSQLVGQLQTETLAEVGLDSPLPGDVMAPAGDSVVPTVASVPAMSTAVAASNASVAAAAPSSAGESAGTAAGTPDYSTTNDQEQGVDEPDLAKTNGQLLVALQQSTDTLEVADVGSTPGLVGELDLSTTVQATGLFLVGSDAVVLGSAVSSAPAGGGQASSSGSSGPVQPATDPGGETVPVAPSEDDTEVVVVDLSNAQQPTVARSFSLQGSEVDARLINGTVEVVVQSSPDLPLVAPVNSSATAVAAAVAANRTAILSSNASSWLPSVTSEPGGTTTTAPCGSALHTVDDSGADTIGIVPIDPNADQPGTEVTVVGDATTVYASATSLYVAYSTGDGPFTDPGAGGQDGDQTVINGFDLSDPSSPQYIGEGMVPGALIGQYAMSEYDGDLRVATTVGTPTPAPQDGSAPATLSDNRITVLAPQNQALVTVGSVTGLGTGEKIYAVRFEGPLAYVVTFDQTDPLYVVDLSNPQNPTVAGQLPLTGYSSFLEPVGNGLLLGVGQDVNASLQDDGLQISLFDVSNPSDPTLLAKDDLPDASSTAESDPHALLYWAPTNMVVLPVAEYAFSQPADGTQSGTPFDGAMAWSVGGDTLTELGQITQPPTAASSSSPPVPVPVPMPVASTPAGTPMEMPMVASNPDIERAIVVGDMLYTVSDTGVLESNLNTLAPLQWMAFP